MMGIIEWQKVKNIFVFEGEKKEYIEFVLDYMNFVYEHDKRNSSKLFG